MQKTMQVKQQLKKLRKKLGKKPNICNDISWWARNNRSEVIDLIPPIYDHLINEFTGHDEIIKSLIFHQSEFRRPETLVRIKGARVRDSVGFVILPDGAFCEQCTWFPPNLIDHPAYYARFRKKKKIDGDVFSLLGVFSESFYHWFHDTLPRLQNSIEYLPSGTKYLIHSNPRKYQLDSLEAFGISKKLLVYQSDIGDTVVERLWFATPSGNGIVGDFNSLKKVSSRLKNHLVGISNSNKIYKKIYISRNKSSRYIENEEAIKPLLKNHEFEFLLLEDLSLNQQAEIFSHAEVIIGAHGAGLTNIIYSNPNTFIGEIAPRTVNPCYLVLAKQFGLRYKRFYAEERPDRVLTLDLLAFQKWFNENTNQWK
jgi:hypothetical protein